MLDIGNKRTSRRKWPSPEQAGYSEATNKESRSGGYGKSGEGNEQGARKDSLRRNLFK